MRIVLIGLLLGTAACDQLTLAGTTRPSDNVAVSVGTTITENGVKPRGKVTIGLF